MEKTGLRNRVVYISLFFVIAAVFSFSCAAKLRRPEPVRVNIAFQEWIGYGLFYLADEKGFFKEEGVEIIFIDEQLDSARRDAFKEGMLDCEAGTLDLLISKTAQDTPIEAVFIIDYSFGSDGVVAAEEIKSLEDLIGKRIALARDDVGETFLSYLFYKKGLKLSDVTIVSRMPEKVSQAFLDGEADACVTWEPWLTTALQRPRSHILASTKENPGIIIDTFNVRRNLVRNNPGLVKKIMRGWFKALKFYKENPDEASGIIAKHYDMTGAQYKDQVKGLKWIDYKEQGDGEGYKKLIDVFNAIAEIKFINGRITKKPDEREAVDHALIEKLYEDNH